MELSLYADGGSRGNPGPAGAGACLLDETGQILGQAKAYLGEKTNNIAEYQALILGLKRAQDFPVKKLKIFMDSQLVVKQIQGVYRVKQDHLIPLYQEALKLLDRFPSFEIYHIPREKNQIADRLANQAMDEQI
ncbi:MAG: ribonuclease HI family protein [Deltaproteobacteria bacterium]|nr:ribonuclease HI family protein [Deltaproteobacteria bacterium]